MRNARISRKIIYFCIMMLEKLIVAALVSAVSASGLVNVPVACLRDEPRHAAQLVSQGVMGTPLEITDTVGEWLCVTMPDGYSGYMTVSSVESRDLRQWRASRRGVVTVAAGCLLTDSVGRIVARVPLNSIVELSDDGRCVLPDGRAGFPDIAPADIADWASQPLDGCKVVEMAYAFHGAPYLWGGMSGAAMDCSGLTSMCYLSAGRIMRRDAWMQAEDCRRLDAPARSGDLIFFDRSGNGRIDHVAMYDSDSLYIHCSGMVKVNALACERGDTISGAVVAFGRPEDGCGATPVSEHPWYF